MIVVFVVFDVILATERLTLGRNSQYGSVVSSTPDGVIEKSLKPAHKPTHVRNKTSGRTLQMDAGGGSRGASRGARRGGGARGGAASSGRGGRAGGGAASSGRVTIKGRLDSLEEIVDKMAQMMSSQQVSMQQMRESLLNIEGGLTKSNESRESQYDDTFRMLEVSFAML